MADSPTNTLSSTFILDNGSPAYFTANLTNQTRPNQPLFQPNATLPEGEHTLRVINGDGTLQLDYFTTTPLVSSTLVQVDDTDPSIQYAGPWNATTEAAASVQPNYNFSLHSTLSPNASLTFSFSGTFVAVYGLYRPGPVPAVSFAIDSIPAAPLTNPPVPIIHPLAQSVLFQSSTLSDQDHTLSIFLDENNQAEFSLDYILYQTSSSPSSSSSPSPTVSSFSAPSAGSQLASQSVSANAGAIAGGILGAVALIVILLFAFKFRRYIYPSANASPLTSIFSKRIQTRLSVSVCTCFFSPSFLVLTPPPSSVSLRSQLRISGAPSPIEDRRTYYVDGSGRPLRLFTGRSRSGSVGTNTLTMPNIRESTDASSSYPSLPKYPSAAARGPRRHRAPSDIEAGTGNNASASPLYGHDEKFALFGQL